MDAYSLMLAEASQKIPLEYIEKMPLYDDLVILISELSDEHQVYIDGTGFLSQLVEEIARKIISERLMTEDVTRAEIRGELFETIGTHRNKPDELAIIDLWAGKYGRGGRWLNGLDRET